MTDDEALVAAVRADWRAADLSERERRMLAHVERLTLRPGEVRRAHLDELRAVGFDDVAIVQINGIAAAFAWLNRMADGLGVGRG